MKEKAFNFLKKVITFENIVSCAVMLCFFFLFRYIKLYGDDLLVMETYQGLSVKEHLYYMWKDYTDWSSRVLVNGVVHVVLGSGVNLWLTLNTILAFVLTKAMCKVLCVENSYISKIVVAAMILLEPIVHLGSAGWLTTTTTYLWPVATGFLALIPIKKCYDNVAMKWWEMLLYAIALIYSANEELVMVAMLFCYTSFLLYFAIKKSLSKFMILQTVLSWASMVFTFTCPGNGSRETVEVSGWFKDFYMLSIVDKMELGLTSTLKEIFYGSYISYYVVAILIAVIIWNKYKNTVLRVLAWVPVVVPFACSMGANMLSTILPNLPHLPGGVGLTGMITLATYKNPMTRAQFLTLFVIAIIFIVCMVVCFEDMYCKIMSVALLFAGVASRMAIGLSPTIWGSGNRTYSLLYFSILAVGCLLFSSAKKEKVFTERVEQVVFSGICLSAVLMFLNNLCYILSL